MKNFVSRFMNDESGATAIEYVLLVALISVAIIVGATAVGQNLQDRFGDVNAALGDAGAAIDG